MTKSQKRYYDYLKSPEWISVSTLVKKRAGYKCQVCNSPHDLQAHHRTYENRGNEINHLDDLICLCRRCHNIFHGTNQPEPAAKEAESIKLIDPIIPDGEHIELTRELILALRTPKNGFTSASLKLIGVVKENMQSGWVKRIVGKRISRLAYQEALNGRFIYVGKKKKILLDH